jgi:hypothetical protein
MMKNTNHPATRTPTRTPARTPARTPTRTAARTPISAPAAAVSLLPAPRPHWLTPRLLLLALWLLTLSACATLEPQTEAVVERAQAHWDAVLAGDLETAYTYYSPGFRSSHSLIDYGVAMRTRRVNWTAATYKDHECEESRCTVRFDGVYRVIKPVPGLSEWESKALIEDTWVKVDGEWWYLPEKQ